MKKCLLILFLFVWVLPVYADMLLEGGVKYNVSSAREEVSAAQKPIPSDYVIKLNLTDCNYKENMSYLFKGSVSLKDRELAFFSDETYGVIYNSNKMQVFYYRPDGQLMNIELRDSLEYPYKSYKYDLSKRLVNMSLRVSKEETFIFAPNGTLIAHWIKNLGYDANGRVIMTRKYVQ